jgi:energy-coupling factor transporter ATP-binding protein EcfA2
MDHAGTWRSVEGIGMHVKRVMAQAFRRFSDLEITDLPKTVKLVLVAGPNGYGKSSLFDIFLRYKYRRIGHHGWLPAYHARLAAPDSPIPTGDNLDVEFHENAPHDTQKSFYIRTAYRNEPEFGSNNITAPTSTLADHRFGRTIDNDVTVAKNFQLLYAQGLEDAFEKLAADTTLGDFREATIGQIRQALARVLPGLHLDSLGNPFKTQSFRFSKGTTRGFNYMNLSGGEKAAFDLILDYVVKKVEFDDTVFCIDEPEAHLNPRVHGDMLSCLFDLTDEKSQLWIATHSIGMLRRARDLYNENPDQVVFLDFERDFDQKQIIFPIKPDRTFWQRSLKVALDDLAELVAPQTIIACESGKKDGAPGEGFDSKIYNSIFASEFPESRFVSIGSSTDMKGDRFLVVQAVANLLEGIDVIRLIDRDGMSEPEIAEHEKNGYRVLRRRNIEAYMFDDDVLRRLCDASGQTDKTDALLAAKQEAIEAAAAHGHPRDDIKKASGRITDACRRILQLQNSGKSSRAFMRDTLAPLIVPNTPAYEELRLIIFA